MFKQLLYKLVELFRLLGTQGVFLYNYLLQTQGMQFVIYYVKIYLHNPIKTWYIKKKTYLYNKT